MQREANGVVKDALGSRVRIAGALLLWDHAAKLFTIVRFKMKFQNDPLPKEPPRGILKTMPPCYLNSTDKEGRWLHEMIDALKAPDTVDTVGFAIGKNIPKQEVQYLYIICSGFVRWRFQVVEYKQSSHRCWDGVVRTGAWVYCTGPVLVLNPPMPMRGFQGWRYYTMDGRLSLP